jgi:hypothetical protein
MKEKLKFRIAAILLLIGAVFFCSAEGRIQGEDQAPKKNPSFIRMGLLQKDAKKLDFPKRNIFSPQALRREMPGISVPGRDVGFQPGDPRTAESIEFSTPENRVNVNLRYIGFIKSGIKITALIDFEGEEIAVEEGDVISEGVTIGKITYQEITIIGSDSQERKFALEGEKP